MSHVQSEYKKAIELLCFNGQHHRLKCPSVERMTEQLVIYRRNNILLNTYLDANEFIKMSNERGDALQLSALNTPGAFIVIALKMVS